MRIDEASRASCEASVKQLPPGAVKAITEAVEEGDAERVRLLISENPDAVLVRPWNADAGSLLHLAAEAGDGGVVALLVERGAALGAVDDDGQTALHVAVANGHFAAVESLTAPADSRRGV